MITLAQVQICLLPSSKRDVPAQGMDPSVKSCFPDCIVDELVCQLNHGMDLVFLRSTKCNLLRLTSVLNILMSAQADRASAYARTCHSLYCLFKYVVNGLVASSALCCQHSMDVSQRLRNTDRTFACLQS